MPSFQHRLFDRALRLIRFRQRYWKQFDGVRTPKRETPPSGKWQGKDFDGYPFYWRDPEGERDGYIVALHGGGYVAEASKGHLGAYGALANLTGKRVYLPYYPLAPFNSPDAILDWTRRFTAYVREHNGDAPVLVVGDSAGANLALQLTHAGETVDRLVLWSPWVDIEGANPALLEQDGKCALLKHSGLKDFARMYHGERDPRDPALSPIFREREDLPPTLIVSGEDDLFHPDIDAYATTRMGQGAPLTYHLEPGVWHDYMLIPTPEAKRAVKMTAEFLSA